MPREAEAFARDFVALVGPGEGFEGCQVLRAYRAVIDAFEAERANVAHAAVVPQSQPEAIVAQAPAVPVTSSVTVLLASSLSEENLPSASLFSSQFATPSMSNDDLVFSTQAISATQTREDLATLADLNAKDCVWTFPNVVHLNAATSQQPTEVHERFKRALGSFVNEEPGSLLDLLAKRARAGADIECEGTRRMQRRFARQLEDDTQSTAAPHAVIIRLKMADRQSASIVPFLPDLDLDFRIQRRLSAVCKTNKSDGLGSWLNKAAFEQALRQLQVLEAARWLALREDCVYRVLECVLYVPDDLSGSWLGSEIISRADVDDCERFEFRSTNPLHSRIIGILHYDAHQQLVFDLKIAQGKDAWAVAEYFSRPPNELEVFNRLLFPALGKTGAHLTGRHKIGCRRFCEALLRVAPSLEKMTEWLSNA